MLRELRTVLVVRGVAKEKRREERRRRRGQRRKNRDPVSSSSLPNPAMASPDAGCTADQTVQQDCLMEIVDPVLRQTEPTQLRDGGCSEVNDSSVTCMAQHGDRRDAAEEELISRLHEGVETLTLCADSTHNPQTGTLNLVGRASSDTADGSPQRLRPLSIAQAAAAATAARFAARQDTHVFGDGDDESEEDTALLGDSTEGQEPVAFHS